MLEPGTLNMAYKYAFKYELDLEGQQKGSKVPYKPMSATVQSGLKSEKKPFSSFKQGQNQFNQDAKTFEQKKALGLCYKCNEKYYPGHKCTTKPLNVIISQEEAEVSEEEEKEGN